MAVSEPILIAGGGIGGLALALALARDGRASVVLERQAQFSTAGAGIQLGPNGVRVLRRLGVADALQPLAGIPEAIVVRDAASARELTRLPLGAWIAERHGAPYLAVHRGDLHRVLLEAASAAASHVSLRPGFEVASVVQGETGVTVTSPAGERVHGPALVGADGLWSSVRVALDPASAPQFAGATATRAVIPAAQAGPLAMRAVGLWLAPVAHVVHYPVRGGSEIAVVVIARETCQGRDWDAEADAPALFARLASFHPSLMDVLRGVASWRKWALYTLPELPVWHRGRMVLLGDAAHPMLPYLAQGGAFAAEDAIVLADCLCASDSIPAAMGAYESARRRRARRAQAASVRQGHLYRLSSPISQVRDAVFRSVPGAMLMSRLDWLYGWQSEA